MSGDVSVSRSLLCQALLVAILVVGGAELRAGATQDPDSILTYEFDEIVVTGSRVSGEILSVPMAVGVVNPKEIVATRRIDLGDALKGMPGVVAQSRAGGSDIRLTIRGFGARGNGDRSNSGTTRGIKVLLDGLPETDPDGRTSFDLVDPGAASRIEVYRSNVSTLFGNASGGVVNIETQSWFPEPQATIQTLGGSFGLFKSRISGGGGGTEQSVSVSGAHTSYSGWRENSGLSNTNLQIKYITRLTDRLTLKVLGQAAENSYEIPGPLTKEEYDTDPQQANATYLRRHERRSNRIGKFGFVIAQRDGEHNFEILGYYSPKFLKRSERGTFRDFNRYHLGGGVTYEWRPENFFWNSSVLVGIDESLQDGTILFYSLVNGERGDSLRTNKKEGANSLGTFVQLSLAPLPSLRIILGGRWDWQTYLSEVYPAGTQQSTIRDELALSHFTPRVAILYRYLKNHSVYASIGGGVEAPAFNEVDPPPSLPGVELNPFLKPMSSTTTEIGAKGIAILQNVRPLRSLSYSVAAYRIQVFNEIIPFDGGSWFFSAGESRRLGLEGSLEIDFSHDISLRGVFTLMDAEYVAYINDVGDFSGKEVPGIVPASASVRIAYKPLFGLNGQLEIVSRDSYFADDLNSISVPGHLVWNAAVGYSGIIGPLQFGAVVGVQNITGLGYASSAYINPAYVQDSSGGFVPSYLEPGLPRNVFAGIDLTLFF